MSKITNYGLTRSGLGYFIAVPIMATVGVKGLKYCQRISLHTYTSQHRQTVTYSPIMKL